MTLGSVFIYVAYAGILVEVFIFHIIIYIYIYIYIYSSLVLAAFHARYTSKVDMACLVALNVSLRLHNYVLFILREQRLSNYEF